MPLYGNFVLSLLLIRPEHLCLSEGIETVRNLFTVGQDEASLQFVQRFNEPILILRCVLLRLILAVVVSLVVNVRVIEIKAGFGAVVLAGDLGEVLILNDYGTKITSKRPR